MSNPPTERANDSPKTYSVGLNVNPQIKVTAASDDSKTSKSPINNKLEGITLPDVEPEPGVDFPSYVRFHGLDTAITRAIVALYEEPCKPHDPLLYVCQQLGYGLLTPEKIISMEEKVAGLRVRAEELESENEQLRNLLYPEEEVEKLDILEDEEIRDLLQRDYEELEIAHIKKHDGKIHDEEQHGFPGFTIPPRPGVRLLHYEDEEYEGESRPPSAIPVVVPTNTAVGDEMETSGSETEDPGMKIKLKGRIALSQSLTSMSQNKKLKRKSITRV